jgi:hypothetical protein
VKNVEIETEKSEEEEVQEAQEVQEEVIEDDSSEEIVGEILALETIPARAQSTFVVDGLFTEGQFNEPERAKVAFRDYVRMGKGRTLIKLAQEYSKPEYHKNHIGTATGWTGNYETILRTLKQYSSDYKWQNRVRMEIVKASAEVLAAAQKEALVNTKHRVRLSQQAQEAGKTIIEKAELNKLSVAEARKMLKEGANLLRLGLQGERDETGDTLAVLRPEKPIREMSDEELEQYSSRLERTLL